MSDAAAPSRTDLIKQYFRDNAVVGESRRFRQLDRYEAHYLCTQYAHLPYDWWGLSADQLETVSPEVQVPAGFTQPALSLLARQKRPTAPYNLAKAVVDRFTGLLFSEKRKPDIEVEGDPDTDGFLHACMEQMRFWPKWREARTLGGSTGSVLVTVHLKKGRFVMTSHNSKHVQILWKDRRALEPEAALILYRYPKEEYERDPRTGEQQARVVDYLYRRIITADDDTVYRAVKLAPNASLDWEVESVNKHKLGFFPGVWIQNMPVAEAEDGDPDCQGAWQTFDTIDRLLAQANKALLLNLDPTLTLKVDAKELAAMGGSVRKGSDNALYVGAGGSANYLEMTGAGVEAAQKLVDRLKQNALDVVRCVMVDPSTISGSAQSAKAIEYIYAPMLEKADDLRAQYGDMGVIPILKIIEQMARRYHGVETEREGKKVILRIDLPKRSDGTPHVLGPGGWIRIKWGAYFAPTETDRQTAIGNIVSAKSAEVIDSETAVRHAALLFDVQDPDAMLERIKADKEAEQSAMFGGGLPGYVEPSGVPEVTTGEEPGPPAGEGGNP